MVLLQKVVHKKYTSRDGKKYGPYFYSTQRKGGKIITSYLGKDVVVMKRPEWRFMLVVAGMVFAFLVLLLYLSYGDLLTGRVSLDIDSSYVPGEVVGGYLHLNLKHGELIPADSLVIANLGEASGVYTLGQILGSSSSSGVFYLEDQNLLGDGLGYGVPGTARAYPNVSFILEVSSEEFKEVVTPEVEVEDENETIGDGNETSEDDVEDVAGNETLEDSEDSSDSADSGDSSEDSAEESSSDSEDNDSVSEDSEEDSADEPSSGESGDDESSDGSGEESSSDSGDSSDDESSEDSGDSDSSEGSSESSGDSSSDSGSGITGEAISEESFTVDGLVSRDSDFSYALESGQSARIVSGSVMVNGESVPDAALELDISSNLVVISTTYSIEVEGFGAEFLGDEIETFDIPLSGFGLVALTDSNLGVNIEYNGESLVSAERDISTVAPPETNITLENVTIEIVNESVGANISLVQQGARLGVPVKWTKTVSLDNPSEIIIELPADASNVGVVSFESSEEDSGATIRVDNEGEVSEEFSFDEETPEAIDNETSEEVGESSEGITEEDFTPERETTLTGNVISDPSISIVESALTTEVIVEQPVSEAVIEYETPAPYSIEREIENGKEILIVGHDTIHYLNVIAFSTIPEEWNIRSQAGLSVYWVESGIIVASSLADGDENGIYDYIEWIAPELSNQTFIIEITRATHLNNSREFISDIYDEVYQLDGNWSETIGDGEYVRVTFERNLTSVNDITIYPRIVSGEPSVEVYDYNGSEILASFNPLVENEYNKVYLLSLGNRTQDTFDLKILNGALEFDHIIDPSPSVTNISSCSFAIVNNNTDYQITNSFSYSGVDYCLNVSASNVTIFGNGYTLTGNPNSLGGIASIGSYNVTINNLILDAWDLGVYLENTNNSYLSNVTIKGAGSVGFILSSSSFNNISNLVIFNTSNAGGDAVDISAGSAYNRFFNINLTNTTDVAIQVVTPSNVFENVNVHQSSTAVSLATGAHNTSILVGNFTDSSVSGFSIGVAANGTFSNIYMANPSFIGSRGISITSNVAKNNQFTNLTILNFALQYFRTSLNSVNGTVIDNAYIQNYTLTGNPGAITTFRKPLYGEVYFFRGINGTGTNLSNDVRIGNNSIIINSTKTDLGTNKTSNITFYNLPTTFTSPVILRDGVTCTICYNFTSLNAGTVIFNTTSGGNYTIYGTLPSDTILPLVSITYPTNTTYASAITALNYSTSDTNLQACWYSLDLGVTNNTITCGTNVTGLTATQGSNTWKVYANDSNGNLNTSSVTFAVTLDTTPPDLITVYPTNISYTSLVTAFNYSVGSDAQACWYSLDLGVTNATITCGTNVTNLNSGQGSSTWKVYANDSNNNLNSSSVTFSVDSIIPLVSIVYPTNTTYTSVTALNYSVSDTNLQACWYSTNLGVTNTTIICGTNVTGLSSSDGSNTWKVFANDSSGNLNSSSVTFSVDSGSPSIDFVSPTETSGIFLTRGNIMINLTASDSSLANITIELFNSTSLVNRTTTLTSPNYVNISSLTNGTYYFNATATDTSNNANSTSTRIVYIDTQSPVVSLIAPANNTLATSAGHSFNATFTDNIQLANVTFNLWNSSGALVNSTFRALSGTSGNVNLSVTLPAQGRFFWNYLAVDNASNKAFNHTNFTILFDSAVPLITVSSPTNTTYSTNSILVYFNASDSNGISSYWFYNGSANVSFSSSSSEARPSGTVELRAQTCEASDSAAINTYSGSCDGSYPSIDNADRLAGSNGVYETQTFQIVGASIKYGGVSISVYNNSIANCGAIQRVNLCMEWWMTGALEDMSGPAVEVDANGGASFTATSHGSPGDTANPGVECIDVTSLESWSCNSFFGSSGTRALARNKISSFNEIASEIHTDALFFNVTYSAGVSANAAEGSNSWIFYANDTVNNFNSSSVTFSVNTDSSPPIVTINSPTGNLSVSQVTFNVTTNEASDSALFSLNGGITNVTMQKNGNSDFNYTNSSIADGNYIVRFYVNDTTGNVNRTASRAFTIDTTKPLVSIVYPTNTTYASVTALNYSVSDTNLQACWYSTNLGVTNTTIICGTNVTGLSSSDGSNTWKVYANDTTNNLNSSSVTFSVDSTYPTFSNYLESPSNNSAYSSGQFYEFNVTVTETNIGTVRMEWDGTNYSTYGSYRFNRTDLGVGTYSYRWWANDTQGNLNSSGLRYYTVAQATGNVTLYLNHSFANITIAQGTSIRLNATLVAGTGTISLYNNGTLINSGSSPISNLTTFTNIGIYNITAIYSGNNNFTSDFETLYVNVVDGVAPVVTINLPTNTTYTNSSLLFNVSLSENGSVIYSLNNGITNYTLAGNQGLFGTNFNSSNSSIADGAYTFSVYANDTFGNNNNTIHVNFSVENLNLLACGTLDRANTEYTLTQGITTSGTCFNIEAENITLNGRGYSISGDGGASDYGVYSEKYNTSVKNLVVNSFGAGGVYYNHALNSSVDNVNFSSNLYGLRLIGSNGTIVSNLLLNSSTQYGLIITFSRLVSVSHVNVYEPSAVAGIYLGGSRINLMGINTTLGQSDKVISTQTLISNFVLNASNIYGAGISDDLNLGLDSNGTLIINTPIKEYSFDDSGSVLTILNSTSGEIAFLSRVNGSGGNLYSEVYTRSNLGFINVSNYALNKSANITLYSMPANFSDPVVLNNGALCSVCYNFTSLNATTVIFNVSYGGSYSVGERPDSIVPSLVITYPTNTTYTSVITALNYSASDTNLQACWYSTNLGVTNTTIICGTNVTGLTASQGSNTWKVYANDSFGHLNSSSMTFNVDSLVPLISFGLGTENDREFMSNLSLYVNISLTESNLANVTFSIYNSSSVVNRTTFDSATYTFNLTNVPAGIYTYEANATDSSGNVNSTGVLTARLVSSCLGLCSEGTGCSITGNSCYLYSDICTGNVCDFTNLTLQNSTIFTLYNGSGDGNSLVLNITSNSSSSISFIKATGGYTGFVFGGKNGTNIGSGSRGGHGGVLNITTYGLFNRTQANFTGRGGYATSGVGGNGSVLQINYHGLIGGAYTAATWSGRVNVTGGKSAGGTAGSNGPNPIIVKDSVCPLDADISNDGLVSQIDWQTIDEVYNNLTGDSTFSSAYDINCDGKLNIIDISRIGFVYERGS
ncbi:MAG: Ig-like domain-containing protein [Nanoarchaeota archaeon]